MAGLLNKWRKRAEHQVEQTNKKATVLTRLAVLELAWLKFEPKREDFESWWANSRTGGRLHASDEEIWLVDGFSRMKREKLMESLSELMEQAARAGREDDWPRFRDLDKSILRRLRTLQGYENEKTLRQYVRYEQLWNNFVYTIAEAPGTPLRRSKMRK